MPDQEWMDSVRASYQPACVEDGLWIVPSWCEPPQPSATNIILEPGLAFGTGEHPTTRLCLKALSRLPLAGKRVIDYGTGALHALLFWHTSKDVLGSGSPSHPVNEGHLVPPVVASLCLITCLQVLFQGELRTVSAVQCWLQRIGSQQVAGLSLVVFAQS